jgi:hypothetical protein
MQSL